MFKKQNAFQSAKANMALVMIFTLVNFVFFLLNINLLFPFSMFTPWLLAIWTTAEITMGNVVFAIIYISIIILIFGGFLGSYLALSKKPKWMILGLIIYILDTIAMIYVYAGFGGLEWVVDAIFHVWVIASMSFAIKNLYKTPTISDFTDNEPKAL